MIGAMFILLLAIFGYFGYTEAMKKWTKYLAERLVVLKDTEERVLKSIADEASAKAGIPPGTVSDTDFKMLLDKNFVDWARLRGIIR